MRTAEEIEEPDEDNMEEINTNNIMSKRTRGKHIDYVEAEQKAKEAGDIQDEDDDDDEDFEAAEVADADKMED